MKMAKIMEEIILVVVIGLIVFGLLAGVSGFILEKKGRDLTVIEELKAEGFVELYPGAWYIIDKDEDCVIMLAYNEHNQG